MQVRRAGNKSLREGSSLISNEKGWTECWGLPFGVVGREGGGRHEQTSWKELGQRKAGTCREAHV